MSTVCKGYKHYITLDTSISFISKSILQPPHINLPPCNTPPSGGDAVPPSAMLQPGHHQTHINYTNTQPHQNAQESGQFRSSVDIWGVAGG